MQPHWHTPKSCEGCAEQTRLDNDAIADLAKAVDDRLAVRELHAPRADGVLECSHCYDGYNESFDEWPCATARIVYTAEQIAEHSTAADLITKAERERMRDYSAKRAVERGARDLAASEQATLHAEEYAKLSHAERRAAAVTISAKANADRAASLELPPL